MKKRFIITQIIVVILLLVCLVSYTYSWSHRDSVSGGYKQTPMSLSYSSSINGNSCTAVTYRGTKDATTGDIIYSTTPLTSLSKTAVQEGTVLYFRTDISNADDAATNVSLFVNYNYSADLEGNYFLGVTAPTVKRFSYPAQRSELDTEEICYVEWVPVVNQHEVPAGDGSSVNSYIEWYIECNAAGNFEISKIILTNN